MTTVTSNQFKSTTIYGTFSNVDSTNGTILADGKFKRNLTVEGNLIVGNVLIKNYGTSNTNFTTGNTDILGTNNTRFGYFTGFLSGYSNVVFGDQSLQNCTGNSNTAIGHNSQNSNTSNNYNTSLGSDSNISGGNGNVAIGCIAQCINCSDSVALGSNVTCTTNNQILLGNSSHTVQIPGNLSYDGLISGNRLSLSGELTCNGLLSVNRLSASGNITFSQTLNNISSTVFSYLNGVTSSIQDQFNLVYLYLYTYLPNQIKFSVEQLKEEIVGNYQTIEGMDNYQTIEGMENYETKIDAANFAINIEENYQSKIDANNFAINVEENYVLKSINNTSSLPTWYITGAGGNGTTPAGLKIGASLNTGGYHFTNVLTYGGASVAAFNTSTAIFRAPTAGTYFFQLNIFKTSTNTIGRNLRFVSYSFMGNQYCHFNEQSADSETAFQWTAMIYLNADGVAYFETQNCPITLFYGPGHTNLTITKIF